MGKKVREYKSGDFIFAKVKGYPAWPARVQKMIGKKYFVYFYGTGEIANLPPNMIFDYAENKDKFLTKTVKRRDFNDGVKQIEYDFANNVPLEQVIGGVLEPPAEGANDTANDTANETMDDSAIADTTTADETMNDESFANTTQNDVAVEDSDDTGALIIDEGKKGRKSKVDAVKTPAKGKEPKTPRGKAKKEEAKDEEEEKKDEEIVSRSGRKIRPKRYIDEQIEDNATLPSPIPKKRRGASPVLEKEPEKEKTEPVKEKPAAKSYNAVTQSELEDLKQPFKPEDAEKDNILITYLPSGQYVGIKLFQSRPNSFKNESARLSWDKQAASNAVTLKLQLERGQITPEAVVAQLVMDLNLTDEEKAALDKERETEEKKSRVQFLKTEMKLIELDAKIKTCLCLEKADTELCLKLLQELMELEVKPLMLLKHPSCLETVKRMRAYVGNTPSWDLSESEALLFGKQAHKIRKQADTLYNNMKTLYTTPDGLSFWEFFSDRVVQFKKATSKLSSDELLELVHEPLEMTMPSAYTMKSAVDAANEDVQEEDVNPKKKAPKTPADKPKKAANNTPSKPTLKRQSSRKQAQEDKEKDKEAKKADAEDKLEETNHAENEKDVENDADKEKTDDKQSESKKESEVETDKNSKEVENDKSKNAVEKDKNSKEVTGKDKNNKEAVEKEKTNKESDKEKNSKELTQKEKNNKESEKDKNKKEVVDKDKNKKEVDKDKNKKEVVDKDKNKKEIVDKEKNKKETVEKDKNNKDTVDKDKNSKENPDKDKNSKDSTENAKTKDTENSKENNSESSSTSEKEKGDKKDKVNDKKEDKKEEESKEDKSDKDDKDISEPRAKRSRESKKTEPPPPRSPAKRKTKL